MNDEHVCPGPGCGKTVPPDQLACPGHWYSVSKATRNRVWRAWNNGRGAGSMAHSEALRQAIAEMR